jgi:pilus assembly protein CpaC
MTNTARTSGKALRLLAAVALLALGSAALPQAAFAQAEFSISSGSAARKVDLGIGQSIIVDLPRDAKEVFVANPKVANAVVRSTRKVFIIGMEDGHTSVMVMDAEGKQIANLEIAIGKDMNVLRRTLKTAIPSSDINVVPVGDTIVLTGSVANAGDAQQAVDIANGFVGSSAGGAATGTRGQVVNSLTIRGKDQVMLKVTVAEVQRTVLKQLGVDMTGSWQVGRFAVDAVFKNPFSVATQALSDGRIQAGGVTLKALERDGVMRTLAEPTLTAISGESAKFMAGGEIPVPQGENCTPQTFGGTLCTTTFTYKPVGVSLNFTPVVLSEGRISMRVATEVTEIDGDRQIKYQDVNAPAFKTRRMDTVVELPSGGVLASAGLIQTQTRQAVNGFPGLMNLPILGTLFRSRDYIREETELVILVTPYIAKPSAPGEIARPDDGFADSSDPQAWLLARMNRLYGGKGGGTGTPVGYKGRAGFVID